MVNVIWNCSQQDLTRSVDDLGSIFNIFHFYCNFFGVGNPCPGSFKCVLNWNRLYWVTLFFVPGPAVPYAPCGPSPAIHSRAGSKTFLDHLQRYVTTLPTHTSWCTAPRKGKCSSFFWPSGPWRRLKYGSLATIVAVIRHFCRIKGSWLLFSTHSSHFLRCFMFKTTSDIYSSRGSKHSQCLGFSTFESEPGCWRFVHF